MTSDPGAARRGAPRKAQTAWRGPDVCNGVSPLKRSLDVLFSGTGIIVLTPAYAVVALLVWAKLGRPILYHQVRPGYKGRMFRIYKFRTMSNEVDSQGRLLSDEDRLLPLFAWIRLLSLDELPQFVNILRGQMSFVGPRPLLESYLPFYSTGHAKRHDMLPGLTGWAQIHGRNDTTWSERLDRDQWYVENWSLRLDLYIVLKTIGLVLRREGNSTESQSGMEEFTGLPGRQDH